MLGAPCYPSRCRGFSFVDNSTITGVLYSYLATRLSLPAVAPNMNINILVTAVIVLVPWFQPQSTKFQEPGTPMPKQSITQPVSQPDLKIATTMEKVPTAPPPVASGATGSESEAKAFIYQKESGNNPNAVNAGGCRGLGQACPGSKLPCGADYACQDAYFTKYAIDRYGSWTAAKAFWLENHWW